MPGSVRIGAGAGFADDRIEPAVELVERGELDFLVFECLAERTIALRQLERRRDPGAGFDPLLRERMTVVLAGCRARGVRIVTNAGAVNPRGAADVVAEVLRCWFPCGSGSRSCSGPRRARSAGRARCDLGQRLSRERGDRAGIG